MCERCREVMRKTIGQITDVAKADLINASLLQMQQGLFSFQVGLNHLGVAGADTKALDQAASQMAMVMSLVRPHIEATAAKLRAEPEIVLGFDKMDWASKPSSN